MEKNQPYTGLQSLRTVAGSSTLLGPLSFLASGTSVASGTIPIMAPMSLLESSIPESGRKDVASLIRISDRYRLGGRVRVRQERSSPLVIVTGS